MLFQRIASGLVAQTHELTLVFRLWALTCYQDPLILSKLSNVVLDVVNVHQSPLKNFETHWLDLDTRLADEQTSCQY